MYGTERVTFRVREITTVRADEADKLSSATTMPIWLVYELFLREESRPSSGAFRDADGNFPSPDVVLVGRVFSLLFSFSRLLLHSASFGLKESIKLQRLLRAGILTKN